ncbi:S-layer homology domain-containing protein [Solibacillus merdavium]|uniref:S-layer homology domain-containing protein n=1 Tax=Solibacillus merdavium TaxID=2762218 RepID=A0ABR8XR44_9BACL|nr:S-layer homology domain-containing protein [Solibacillus merdavium]MBD8034344.1 S-layer homology domain-containing protein [Solibacillus merdavium]
MDSKKGKKLSKATVATVLAASGVIVAMPQQTNAYSFSDLNPFADYYEPILDLASRKIATGYSDGTFKPNQAITREDAAKMLALTIDVNITNPKNPGFKDVQMSNPNYRYIAALAEAGVINGYSDKTFKPKEPITRGQMAKILTLGFKFGVSSKLNHGFKDVNAKNANAYFIQTLYDLNVTKGKTPVSFDPFNTVTRAQMATFIWRAEKADRGNPVYAIGDITGNQIYINGVAHTIAPHLRSILNAANKNVLQGAFIEGNFSGNTVQNISKLTINASGNSSRLLALDGGYSSFAGELIVHGSYVRFKNINFTGRVEVAEAPRRSLASLSNIRIASVGNVASFIDWEKPTVPKNEEFLNPIDKETLQEKPDPTKPPHLQKYTDRMSNLKKYVDFENSDIRHLYVTSDRTFVKANYEIDRLTLQGNVANVELYASPNAMYIDTDYNVSVFGVHDIQYVYKNTLKNVSFKTDSTYDYYYITSSHGFTDIGSHVYITNAIIPPNKTVNDVFDDYKTDDPNIGYIKDENGKAVDRDPVENTIIPDVTGPKITQLDVAAGGSTADVTLTADEDGTYYYVVKPAKEKAPTINEIKTGGTKYNGNGPLVMDEPVKFTVNGLETMTDYVIYAIVIDKMDNVSEKEEQEFSTIDNRPPTFRLDKGETMYGGKRVQFVIKGITEPGEYYYYIREKSPVTLPDPTVDEIMKRYTGKGTIAKPDDVVITETKYGASPAIGDIKPNTEYEIYAVMVDKSGNKMRNPAPKITLKTEAPDTTYPYVLDPPELQLADKEKGYFYINVSEELDKATAENPDNYLLSGTGIVNISGHKEMKPVEVQYSNKRIRLTIPAVSSLVNGDTIVATVLKGVKDLAENEFENKETVAVGVEPRNYAQYNHTDSVKPELTIKNVITGPNKYEVEVEAKKAGTYYYMILPNDFDFKDITSRDFVDEFSNDPKVITGKFKKAPPLDKENHYIGNGQNPAPLGTFKFDVTKPGTPPRDPFKSYKIYMVLKDRSGQLSEIMNKNLIDDVKPPLVTGVMIENVKDSDTQIKFTANVDEKANFYVLPVRKYKKETVDGKEVYVLNTDYFDASGILKDITAVLSTTANAPDLFNKFKSLGAKDIGGSTGKGTFIDIPRENLLNLTAHEEYGFYIGAVDTIGNFTILEKSSAVVIEEDEPKGPQMKKTLYMDGTNPHIKNDGLVTRQSNSFNSSFMETTFTITFNEAIMRQDDLSGLSNYNKTAIPASGTFNLSSILEFNGADINDYEFVSYSVGTSTTSESKLIIRPKNARAAMQTFRVKMKEDTTGATVYDYKDQNGFDTTKIGTYIYPASIINQMSIAQLSTPYVLDTIVETSSKKLNLSVDFDVDLGLVQRYYYAVVLGTTTIKPTAEEVINAVRTNTVSSSSPIYIYGSDMIDGSAGKSQVLPLETGKIRASDVFKTGHKIYMFTVDKYGNIVWAKHKTMAQDYIEITK